MILNLKQVIENPDIILNFKHQFDLSSLEFWGSRLINEPVEISGAVKNHLSIISLTANINVKLEPLCALCNKKITINKEIPLDYLLVDHVADDVDNRIEIANGTIDLDEIVETAVILNVEMRYLCKQDCKGLCQICGADLNENPCTCGGNKHIDPRLSNLADLLNKE